MTAAVKYGFIGGVVSLVILITQYYFVNENIASHPAFKYLVQLSLFVSIIASIKITKDKEITDGAIDLKSGLRAGVITTILVVLIVSAFFFFFYKTMTHEKFSSMSDKQFSEYFSANPVKDKGDVHFEKLIFSADSAISKNNFGSAKMNVEIAKQIKNNDSQLIQKSKEINSKLFVQCSSNSFVISNMIVPTLIGQLLIGMVIAFFTTMVFRYKYQSDNS